MQIDPFGTEKAYNHSKDLVGVPINQDMVPIAYEVDQDKAI